MSKYGKGFHCAYCTRRLEAKTSPTKLAATKDHVLPKSRGGRGVMASTVWCCRQCNTLKGNMMPEEWSAFMRTNPRWWTYPQYQYGIKLRDRRECLGPAPFTVGLGPTCQPHAMALAPDTRQPAGAACEPFCGLPYHLHPTTNDTR